MSAAIDAMRAHLTDLSRSFYPGGSGPTPDPVICQGSRLGLIFDSLAYTHRLCIGAAQAVNRRYYDDYETGGVMTAIAADLRKAGLELITARWNAAVEAYAEAVQVVEQVAAARASK